MSLKIPLTQGKFTLVDNADYEWLNKHKWYVNHGYAVSGFPVRLRMHRLILGLDKTDSRECDHINGNKLDNRRFNLRICNKSQNQQNRISRTGSSKYKGVTRHKKTGRWQAQIRHQGKRYYLGLYINEVEAAQAYNERAKKLFGEFARLNILKEEPENVKG
jgi:hypothetical protein